MATARAVVERRRSTRISVQLPLVVCGEAGLREQTCIFCLNTHGMLVALAASVTIGQRLILHNPENWAERSGRVARVGRLNAGRTEVGIEFTERAPDFWLLPAGPKRVEIEPALKSRSE